MPSSPPDVIDEPPASLEDLTRAEIVSALLRLALGLGALVVLVALLAMHYRAPLERLGHAFVGRFGVLGVAGGSFLADGAHLPLPPQFFLLAGEAGGMPAAEAIGGAVGGSTLGGLCAFAVARRLSCAGRFGGLTQPGRRTGRVLSALYQRHGYLGVALAGTLPVSFSLVCILSGALKLPWRAYAVLAAMRIPRLLLSYAVIAFAWSPHG